MKQKMCFVVDAATNKIVAVKEGEIGYYESTVYDLAHADLLNARMGITHAMREAMLVGSMFGWDVSGAREDRYQDAKSLVDCAKPKRK